MSDKINKAFRRMEENCAKLGANVSVNYFMRGLPLDFMKPPSVHLLHKCEASPDEFRECAECKGKGFVNWDTAIPNDRCNECLGAGQLVKTSR